jgi:predicted RecB family nuclease
VEAVVERSDGQDAALLGAYAARLCAVRTQWDVVRPCEPAPDTPFRHRLAERGIAFEADVVAELITLHPDAVVIDRDLPGREREAATLRALAAGGRIVIGARLPVDAWGGRTGEPDLLVRHGESGYVPVEIKHRRILDRDAATNVDAAIAAPDVEPLADLERERSAPRPGAARGQNGQRADLLQLAHYHRMLEACGHAATVPVGAVIGRERMVVWSDLAEPGQNVLDAYDDAFAHRREVALAAAAHVRDPWLPLPLAPVSISECPSCRWREHCFALLEAREDVSLLPRVTRPAWEALRSIGADTIPQLAALPAGTRVADMTDGALAQAVAQARARTGPDVAYRRPGTRRIHVERADIELDVDMENVEDGAYLWGVLVTDRSGSGLVTPGYHAFFDWDADASLAGVRAFEALWGWLSGVRVRAEERALTLRAYCWSEAAENRWLRIGAAGAGRSAEVERFIASDTWVDLLRVFDAQVITGRSSGLKIVARLLGFDWDEADPSGAESMVWWEGAVDTDATAAERERLRARILAYNRDDVRATLHVREWLTTTGPQLHPLPDRP